MPAIRPGATYSLSLMMLFFLGSFSMMDFLGKKQVEFSELGMP